MNPNKGNQALPIQRILANNKVKKLYNCAKNMSFLHKGHPNVYLHVYAEILNFMIQLRNFLSLDFILVFPEIPDFNFVR